MRVAPAPTLARAPTPARRRASTPTRETSAASPSAASTSSTLGVALAASAALALASPVDIARADVFYAGAGEPAFLESTYRDLGYKGVTSVVPGTFDDGARGVKVEYDASRIGYEALLQSFWRHCEPSPAEIGRENEPVLYATSAREMRVASEQKEYLASSGIFGKDGPRVTIREGAPTSFEDSGERDALKTNPKRYEKMAAKRQARFNELWGYVQFCYERVCGYVRFAPKCVDDCLKVFPEYLASNAGIPEITKDVKITGRFGT